MPLIAATRVRNEEDIIESFVRHTAAVVDRIVLLDNGSTDRTSEILAALKQEGLPLTVYRADSVRSMEAAHSTFLFRQAVALGAEWVLCLDCDEFLDLRLVKPDLRSALAAVPGEVVAVTGELMHYHHTSLDDPAQMVTPRRQAHRAPSSTGIHKVFARGALAKAGAVVADGNHHLLIQDQQVQNNALSGLRLAHFPTRNGWQMMAKALVGRLKVIAAGEGKADQGIAVHYKEMVSHIWDNPDWLLKDKEIFDGRPPQYIVGGAILDPTPYFGSELKYTHQTNWELHSLRSTITYQLALAEAFGALTDALPEASRFARERDSTYTQVA